MPQDLFRSRKKLYCGWDLYYFGHSVQQVDNELFLIARSGMIVAANHPFKNTILIDALVAGGNSGGAAFLKPNNFAMDNLTNKLPPFIGIISKTLVKQQKISLFQKLEYVAGLSFLISTDAITDLFYSENY